MYIFGYNDNLSQILYIFGYNDNLSQIFIFLTNMQTFFLKFHTNYQFPLSNIEPKFSNTQLNFNIICNP